VLLEGALLVAKVLALDHTSIAVTLLTRSKMSCLAVGLHLINLPSNIGMRISRMLPLVFGIMSGLHVNGATLRNLLREACDVRTVSVRHLGSLRR